MAGWGLDDFSSRLIREKWQVWRLDGSSDTKSSCRKSRSVFESSWFNAIKPYISRKTLHTCRCKGYTFYEFLWSYDEFCIPTYAWFLGSQVPQVVCNGPNVSRVQTHVHSHEVLQNDIERQCRHWTWRCQSGVWDGEWIVFNLQLWIIYVQNKNSSTIE